MIVCVLCQNNNNYGKQIQNNVELLKKTRLPKML